MNTVHFWQNSHRLLFLWSLEFLGVPPVLLIAGISIVGVVVAFMRQQPIRTRLWRTWHWLIFIQLLFFPAIVAIGVLFPAPDGPRYAQGNKMGEWLLDGVFYFSLATSIFWWWRMKGLRWLAASLLVFQQVILVGAGFAAGMRVNGDWL